MFSLNRPQIFQAGETLDPRDLNQVWRYISDLDTDTKQRRFRESVLPLHFVVNASTGYTQADTAETRTFRFKCPVPAILTRAFLTANVTCAADVNVVLEQAGTTPTGATNPLLTVASGAVASVVQTDISVSRIALTKDLEYEVRIESTGTFDTERFDVHLHLQADRLNTTGSDADADINVTLVAEDDARNAVTQSTQKNAFDGALLGTTTNAPMPAIFGVHDMTSPGLPALEHREFPLPRFGSPRSSAQITSIFLAVEMASAPVGGSVKVEILDALGNVVETASVAMAGLTQATTTIAATRSLTYGQDNAPATPAFDYSLRFSSTTSTNVRKAYCILWVQ